MKFITPFVDVGSAFKLIALIEAFILVALWFIEPIQLVPGPLEIAVKWNELATQ